MKTRTNAKCSRPHTISRNAVTCHIHKGSPFAPPPEGPRISGPPSKAANVTTTSSPFATKLGISTPPKDPSGAPDTSPSAGASDSHLSGPIGGRLQLFHRQWVRSTLDSWMRRVTSQGLSIEFTGLPLSCFLSCPTPGSHELSLLMSAEISHLLNIKAIEQVPPNQHRRGFYSVLFLVPKSSGGWRGILNLKHLNLSVCYHRFKMHSLQSILGGVR